MQTLPPVRRMSVVRSLSRGWRLVLRNLWPSLGLGWMVGLVLAAWSNWDLLFGLQDDLAALGHSAPEPDQVLFMAWWRAGIAAAIAALGALLLTRILAVLWGGVRTGHFRVELSRVGPPSSAQAMLMAAVWLVVGVVMHLVLPPLLGWAERHAPGPATAVVVYALTGPVWAYLLLSLCDLVVRDRGAAEALSVAGDMVRRNAGRVLLLAAGVGLAIVGLDALLGWGTHLATERPWAELPIADPALRWLAALGRWILTVLAPGVGSLAAVTAGLAGWLYAYRDMALEAGLLRARRREKAPQSPPRPRTALSIWTRD